MDIEDAFTEDSINTLSSLTETDQVELRTIAARIFSDNKIVEVEQTIDVCVLFFVAGGIYQDSQPFTVEMDREEYAQWVAFLRERGAS